LNFLVYLFLEFNLPSFKIYKHKLVQQHLLTQ